MKIHIITPDLLGRVWPVVAPMLEKSLETGWGECTIDQLRLLISQGKSYLFVALDDEIYGAMTIDIYDYPNKRVAFGTAFGGKGVCTKEAFETIKEWCKGMGAQEFRTFSNRAQTRLYHRVGFRKIYDTLSVDLE